MNAGDELTPNCEDVDEVANNVDEPALNGEGGSVRSTT